MSDLLTLLKEEHKRVAEALPTFTPGSEEHLRAFELLRSLRWEIYELEHPAPAVLPRVPTFTPVEGVVCSGATEPDDEGDTKPDFDVDKFRTALRERMADARLAGVNTTDLLKAVGAAKLSSVTEPAKLKELSELVDKAMKEKG